MQTLTKYAFSFLGTPYLWGGSSYFGIDCSSLIMELLKSVGMAPAEDSTADGLYRFFLENGDPADPSLGALAFFGTDKVIKHIGFCVCARRMIHAAGGNEWITTEDKARASGACVRMDLISYRKDLVKVIKPRYSLNGWQ